MQVQFFAVNAILILDPSWRGISQFAQNSTDTEGILKKDFASNS